MGIHVVFDDKKWAHIQDLLKNAGHEIEVATVDNVHTFISKLETQFPEVYAGIKKGVADAKDPTKSGGEKAVAVALDVLAMAPAVLTSLPGIKDVMVAAVTHFFAAEVSAFKTVSIGSIQAL